MYVAAMGGRTLITIATTPLALCSLADRLDKLPRSPLDVVHVGLGAMLLFVVEPALEEDLHLAGGEAEVRGALQQGPDARLLADLDLLVDVDVPQVEAFGVVPQHALE